MATTTARITISSNNLTSAPLSVTHTSTLTKADGCIGLDVIEQGVKRSATAAKVKVLDDSTTSATADGSNKVYLCNLGTSSTEYWTVKLDSSVEEEIGRLYGGDWMFIPFQGGTGNDLEITPSSTTETILEYILFYE